MKKMIPYSNRSPYGWWIAAYVLRFEYYDEDKKIPIGDLSPGKILLS